MKLIAILLSIVMTGAPNSMTNQGSLFTSANVLNMYSAEIYQVPANPTLALPSLLT